MASLLIYGRIYTAQVDLYILRQFTHSLTMDYKQKRIPSSPIFHLEEKKSEDGGSEPFLTPKELSEVHARTDGITIASLSDLAKLSFLEIKNLPLGKCRGEIFEAALKQAIELEKEGQVKVNSHLILCINNIYLHNAQSAKVEGISKGQVVTMNQMVPFKLFIITQWIMLIFIQKHHPAVHKIKFIVFQIRVCYVNSGVKPGDTRNMPPFSRQALLQLQFEFDLDL